MSHRSSCIMWHKRSILTLTFTMPLTSSRSYTFALLLALVFTVAVQKLRLLPRASYSSQPHIVFSEPLAQSRPHCRANPYLGAIEEPLEVIAKRSYDWLRNITAVHKRAVSDDYKAYDYERFFPFEVMATCRNESKSCIGGSCRSDESKIMCGADQLTKGGGENNNETCIIYSIGSNNQWMFEEDALKKTPCQVHTFDCTGDPSRFEVPKGYSDRLQFHHVCLSDRNMPAQASGKDCNHKNRDAMCGESWTLLEMQQKLGHKRIDLFKIDVEGWEWPLLTSWPEMIEDKQRSEKMLLPMQVMVEIHYRTGFPQLLRQKRQGDFRSASDHVELQAHLLRMGYVVVNRDDNRFCKHCTELTLLRAQCPETGVYNAMAK